MGYLEKDALPAKSLCSRYSTQQRRPIFDASAPMLKLLHFASQIRIHRNRYASFCLRKNRGVNNV